MDLGKVQQIATDTTHIAVLLLGKDAKQLRVTSATDRSTQLNVRITTFRIIT
jgi:hypothetical protein